MFFKKEQVEQEKCHDCGAYIDKINKVVVEGIWLEVDERFYCGKCKKPYIKIKNLYSLGVPTKYFAELEVDENGKPVKKV